MFRTLREVTGNVDAASNGIDWMCLDLRRTSNLRSRGSSRIYWRLARRIFLDFFESNFPLSFSSRTFPCFFRVEFSLVFFEANFPPIFAAAASGQGLIKLIDRITHRQNLFRSLLAINFSRVYMTAQSGLSSFEHWQREIRALLSSSKHNGTPGNTSTYVFSQSLRARL